MKNLIWLLLFSLIAIQSMSAQDKFLTYVPDLITVKNPNPNVIYTAENLIDDNLETRWRSNRTTSISTADAEWIQFTYNEAKIIDSLYLVSANINNRNRDPKVFKVMASNDQTAWKTLYTSDNSVKFTAKSQQKKFFLNNEKAYKSYRIQVTKLKGNDENNISLSELTLIGRYVLTEKDLKLEIYQIKVSEGHATLIVVKNKRYNEVISSTLIDAGKIVADGELIASVIKSKANSILNKAFITHYDEDHYGGFNSKGGLLELRCKIDNDDVLAIVPENPTESSNKLNLYGVNGNSDYEVPNSLTANIQKYRAEGTLKFKAWKNDTDLDLESTKNIRLITLGVNTVLKDGLTRSEKVNKNNRSAIALIVWGDFTFLIQGDLQGGGNKGGNIGRTNLENSPLNTVKRIPKTWDEAPVVQQAQTISIRNNFSEPRDTREGIVRVALPDVDVATSNRPSPIALIDAEGESNASLKKKKLSMYYNKYYIAYPDRWLHNLGSLINAHNGSGGYAHACISLIPHHGAMTSNVWFDSKYGIISNNAKATHGHPVPQAIEAVYHTAGISNLYFTYLSDNKLDKNGNIYNRATELNTWRTNYTLTNPLDAINFHVLETSQEYFKIEVEADQNDGMKKKFKMNKQDNDDMSSFIACPSH